VPVKGAWSARRRIFSQLFAALHFSA
jgi:hypothetical protein